MPRAAAADAAGLLYYNKTVGGCKDISGKMLRRCSVSP